MASLFIFRYPGGFAFSCDDKLDDDGKGFHISRFEDRVYVMYGNVDKNQAHSDINKFDSLINDYQLFIQRGAKKDYLLKKLEDNMQDSEVNYIYVWRGSNSFEFLQGEELYDSSLPSISLEKPVSAVVRLTTLSDDGQQLLELTNSMTGGFKFSSSRFKEKIDLGERSV